MAVFVSYAVILFPVRAHPEENRGGGISTKQYLIGRAQRILTPYFMYSLLYLLYNILQVVVLHKDIDLIKNTFGILVNIRGTEYTVGLWFLPLLLIVDTIVVLIMNLQLYGQIIAVVGISAFGFIYAKEVAVVLPWGIDAALIVTLFVYGGYVLRDRIIGIRYLTNRRKLRAVCFAVVALVLNISFNVLNMLTLSECVDMHAMRYGNPCLYIISAFFGICFVVDCCTLYSESRVNKLVIFVGQNTIHIYCIHTLVLAVLKKVNEYLCMENLLGIVATDLVMATIALVVSCIWTKVISIILRRGNIRKKRS